MSEFIACAGTVETYHVSTAPIERDGMLFARLVGPFAAVDEAQSAAESLAKAYPLSPPCVISMTDPVERFDHAEAEQLQLRARADLVALLVGIHHNPTGNSVEGDAQ